MEYSTGKTIGKASVPFIVGVLVNAAIYLAKSAGVEIDETTIWNAALAGYGALVGLINWIKNRKKT